jgi:hypothetical protein
MVELVAQRVAKLAMQSKQEKVSVMQSILVKVVEQTAVLVVQLAVLLVMQSIRGMVLVTRSIL